MAQKKLTLTPFARLFLVLLVVGPLSYIGASYYNGEDGIQNIKNIFGIGSETKAETPDVNSDDSFDLKSENSALRKEVETLKKENEELRKQLEN